MNAAILVLGAVRALSEGFDDLLDRVIDAAIVAALLLLLRNAYHRYRGRHGLGLGDVKFLTAATLWTGLEGLPALVLVASGTALAAIAMHRLFGGEVGWSSRFRFGPCLAFALLTVVLFPEFAV